MPRKLRLTSALFDKAMSDARPIRAAALANNTEKALSLIRGNAGAELQQARQAAIDSVDELRASVDRQSDDLTRKTHRAILITWLVVCLGLGGNSSLHSLYCPDSGHWRVTGCAWQRPGPRRWTTGSNHPLSQPDERNRRHQPCTEHTSAGCSGARDSALGEGRGFGDHGGGAVLARILQSVGKCLFSRLSKSIPLLYAALYVADESRTRLVRVGGFALDGPDQTREFALGEGLVGQAAVERRPLVVSANDGRSRPCLGRDRELSHPTCSCSCRSSGRK